MARPLSPLRIQLSRLATISSLYRIRVSAFELFSRAYWAQATDLVPYTVLAADEDLEGTCGSHIPLSTAAPTLTPDWEELSTSRITIRGGNYLLPRRYTTYLTCDVRPGLYPRVAFREQNPANRHIMGYYRVDTDTYYIVGGVIDLRILRLAHTYVPREYARDGTMYIPKDVATALELLTFLDARDAFRGIALVGDGVEDLRAVHYRADWGMLHRPFTPPPIQYDAYRAQTVQI